MNQKVIIRADGNSTIGLGHLFRCFALAEMIRSHYEITFVCQSIPASFRSLVESRHYFVKLIQQEEELVDFVNPKDIIVVDHYELDETYHRTLKKQGCFVLCIDDIHQNNMDADIIINPAPGVQKEDYRSTPNTRFALGLDYVLLRKDFLDFARKDYAVINNKELIICFGGSDAKNLTLSTLQTVQNSTYYSLWKKVHIILGEAYLFKDSLLPLLDNKSSLHENLDAQQMLQLFSNCELIIVPSSGVLIEALVTSNKIISGMYIDNQRNFYQHLREMNAFIDAADFNTTSLSKAFAIASDSKQHSPKKWIDGHSPERILNLFKSCR